MGIVLSCFSNLLVMAEKMSLWLTCTVLICCLVCTITVVLGLGIGLGYNYCFTDMMTRYRYVPGYYTYEHRPRWLDPLSDNEDDPTYLVSIPPMASETATMTTTAAITTPSTTAPSSTTLSTKTNHVEESKPINQTAIKESTTTESTTKESLRSDVSNVQSNNSLLSSTPSMDKVLTKITFSAVTLEAIPSTKPMTPLDDEEAIWLDPDRPTKPSPNDKIYEEFDDNTTETSVPKVKPDAPAKIAIPVSALDLLSLISKLRADGKNYTLQLITS